MPDEPIVVEPGSKEAWALAEGLRVMRDRQEGVARIMESKGDKKGAELVRKYGVVGAFDRIGEE